MIKVKFLKNTVANKQCVKIDQVVELDEKEARLLVGMKKAVIFTAPPVKDKPKAPVLTGVQKSKETTKNETN